jgi:hypothetical protein
LEMYNKLVKKLSESKWESFTSEIAEKDFVMTIQEVGDLFIKYRGTKLLESEKECLWETFKLKTFLEDNPDRLEERQVTLKGLVESRQ